MVNNPWLSYAAQMQRNNFNLQMQEHNYKAMMENYFPIQLIQQSDEMNQRNFSQVPNIFPTQRENDKKQNKEGNLLIVLEED